MRESTRGLPRAQVRGGRDGGWLGWLIAAALLPPGWLFIAHAHRWHLTPSVVVLCLAWTALVGAGLMLVRAANATIDPVTDDWFSPAGSRDELEREKKILIRAIKDIEFDRDTGKLTPADAAMLVSTYRGRAIEVIKALELDAIAETPRARIMAELEARAQLARTAGKGAKAAKAAARKAAAVASATTPKPPIEAPPVEVPPSEAPAVEDPPAEVPAIEEPAIETPPMETPPVEVPPIEEPAIEEAPGPGRLASRKGDPSGLAPEPSTSPNPLHDLGLATNPPNSTVAASAASEEVAS